MKKVIFTLLFFACFAAAFGQKVFVTKYTFEAQVKVFEVKYKSEAGWKNKAKAHLFR